MQHRGLTPSGAIAALVAALAAAAVPPAAAEPCSAGIAGVATSCEAAAGLAQDLARRRTDRTLAADPVRDRARRLDGAGTPQPTDTLAPFAMSGDNGNVNFDTSLTQWGSALSAADIETLKQARAQAGGEMALPQPAGATAPRFDLWAQGRHARFIEAGAKQGNALTTAVGADYRWDRNLLVGGMLQLDDSRQTVPAAPDASAGTAFLAGPYLAYRLAPNVMLDAKAGWGTAHDSATAGADTVTMAGDRMLAEARLTGNWSWNAWRFSQSGALTYFDETQRGGIAADAASLGVTRFTLSPEVKRHIEIGSGTSVEPFAFFKSSLDLTESDWNAPVGRNTVGGGVQLAKPDKYRIRAAADFSEDAAGAEAATGKVQVSVPSSLLGF